MKNETIKTYTGVTPLDALRMLVENGGTPVEGLAFGDDLDSLSTGRGKLKWVQPTSRNPFAGSCRLWRHCAKVTEIDPCKAPEGCPEMDSWMAYVKAGDGNPMSNCGRSDIYRYSSLVGGWETGDFDGGGNRFDCHYAIDVRTEWAQEHFPEHCRIRNYQEPNPLDEWIDGRFGERSILDDSNYLLLGFQLKELFELGQKNPVK